MTEIVSEIVRLPERTHPRFVWLLPLVFAVGTVLGSFWPGHDGHLFFLGTLVGVWACSLFDVGNDVSAWILPTLLGGVPILLLLGLLLDRLRADLAPWLAVSLVVGAVAGFVLMQGHGDLDAARAYHGSFLGYAVCALQLGSYGGTLVVLGILALRGRA